MPDINNVKEGIVKFIVDPLIVVDAEKKIRIANETILYLLGYREEELIGRHIEGIFTESRLSILRKENLDKLLGAGTILNIETFYQSKDGKSIPVLFSSSIMKDKEDRISWIICMAKDITEQKRTEEELKAAYGRLKETQDQLIQVEKFNAIGLLASGVAHEVKNPLGVIIQGINYLEARMSSKGKDIGETLEIMKKSVNRANKIVNSLLDFSRAKKLDLQEEDINYILKGSLDLVKANCRIEGINIIVETKDSAAKALVDKNRAESVFVNLLMNAIQAMPNGGKIIIRVYEKPLEDIKYGIVRKKWNYFNAGDRLIVVEIEDTGVGIPEEILGRLFNPFVTTKSLTGGSGIGLYVSRNIIDMHKGLIDIESSPGKGSKAIVILKAL